MSNENKPIEINSNNPTLNESSELASSSLNRSIHEFDFNLICDFFSNTKRQGPGSPEVTLKALSFIDNLTDKSLIADIGCGTGGQTMTLGEHVKGKITGLDLFPKFIDIFNANAEELNLQNRVKGIVRSMDNLPFQNEELDLIWSEGAIYNIGFERGLSEWRKYLKTGGYIAVSDIAWFTDKRPAEIENYCTENFPEMDTIPYKVALMQKAGYVPVASFILPENCWTEHFFAPLIKAEELFFEKYGRNSTTEKFVALQRQEEEIYNKYKEFFGYVFYIGKNRAMIDLNTYGWNDKLNQLKQESTHNVLSHGRVTVVHRTCYEVISENGLFQCELTGNMMFGKSDFELPCTGDWVIFQSFDESKGIIVDMLPRERTLYRKKSGTVADKQAIASYVDKAFIVQSLDDNFNVRRVERFMFQILEEDIKPVLVLNKADLGFDRQKIDEAIKHIANRIPVFITSIHHPEAILQLRESISEGETVVFVGSSGVGKSSLVNMLCGKSTLLTSDISVSTGKGRHTSTRREMVLMDGSGILIDTPGVREFGLTIDDPHSLAEMLEISDYTRLCRFADCTHTNEPDCAVLEAVNNGALDQKVYESYLKLRREAWHFSTSEHEKRKRDKSFAKLVDEVKKLKTNL